MVCVKKTLQNIVLLMIKIYQYSLSPLIGKQCRFYPTCSVYTKTAIEKNGIMRGLSLSLRRIFRCNPWHPGGYDPVPPSKKSK